jgi:hypothetical protein
VRRWPASATRAQPLGKEKSGGLPTDSTFLPSPRSAIKWMSQGETVKLVTPGQNQKHSLAGALELKTGRMVPCLGVRRTDALFRALRGGLERR